MPNPDSIIVHKKPATENKEEIYYLFVLDILKMPLSQLLIDKLQVNSTGIPFTNFEQDPPQLSAIKKIINGIYHVENAVRAFDLFKENYYIHQAPLAIQEVYYCLSFFDEAAPDVRELLRQNYQFLEPLYNKAYEVIQKTGWVDQFLLLDKTEKISEVSGTGIRLLGKDTQKWNKTHPLITTFDKFAKLTMSFYKMRDPSFTEQARLRQMNLIQSLLDDLDNNDFFNQLTISDFENAKAARDLLDWFKNIQSNGFNFTKESIEHFILTLNTHVSELILIADKLERKNFFDCGLLSKRLCTNLQEYALQVNYMIDTDSTFEIPLQMLTMDSIRKKRLQQAEDEEVQSVKVILDSEDQIRAAALFFGVMESYKSTELSKIIESDRVLLREVYPQLQMHLAHADLAITNILTGVLNTKGPAVVEAKQPSIWAQFSGYMGSYVKDYETNKVLKTKAFINTTINRQIEAEKFKVLMTEKSSDYIRLSLEDEVLEVEYSALEERATLKIKMIKERLKKLNYTPQEKPSGIFDVIKIEQLDNLTGTLTLLQQKKLSAEVKQLRISFETLVEHHIAKEGEFHQKNQVVYAKDAKIHNQLKQIQETLLDLENVLVKFEAVDFCVYGLTARVLTYIEVAKAIKNLKNSLIDLEPEYKNKFLFLIHQLNTFKFSSVLSHFSDEALSDPGQNSVLRTTPETKPPALPTDYVKKIFKIREALLDRYNSNLSQPLTFSLNNKQESGVPYIDIEQDAPQIAALKKLINSLYYAEGAIKTWQEMDSNTAFGKIAAAHQSMSALSQLYKALQLFTEVTPEAQNLFIENYDLIEPIITYIKDIINENKWTESIYSVEWSTTIGKGLGQIIAAVQSPSEEQTQAASFMHLFTELPSMINSMANAIGGDSETSIHHLKISESRSEAIKKVLELFLEKETSLLNLFKIPQAILGLLDLNTKFQNEAILLQEASIKAYQEWLKDLYPKILLLIDERETRYYMKPGRIANRLIFEVDRLNDKLNEVIESKPGSLKLKKIALSTDLAALRQKNLNIRKIDYWKEIFLYDDQFKSADIFFNTLKRYSKDSFTTIEKILPEHRVILREQFAQIQLSLANTNLDLANQCVTVLNEMEILSPEQWKGVKNILNLLLNHETEIVEYIAQRRDAISLKIKVIDQALHHIQQTAEDHFVPEPGPNVDALRQDHYAQRNQQTPAENPIELIPIDTASLFNIRGNLAYIQKAKLSSMFLDARKCCHEIIKNNFSKRVHEYLKKEKGQNQHTLKADDPTMVRQIKFIENGLNHLEVAFKQFETLKKNDTLVNQTRTLVEIQRQASELRGVLEKLCPELKIHYGPLVNGLSDILKKMYHLDYNRADVQDFSVVLQSTKEKILARKKPRKIGVDKAYFEAHSQEILINSSESASAKARRLGVKYLHLISPTMEDARKYLRARYPNSFESQAVIIRNYTRQQLQDKELIRKEITRLTHSLEENYGFNLTTIGIFMDVANQIQRVCTQTSEVVGMANKLVTDDYMIIKEKAYKDLIIKLSREEDYLCLKSGTLIGPAMTIINQLFLSAALELDMDFDKKLSILDDKLFYDLMIKDLNQEIQTLITESKDSETDFKIKIKQDKLEYLIQQRELVADKDMVLTKSALLDMQFEVYMRKHLKSTLLKSPLLGEYESILRTQYSSQKTNYLTQTDCTKALYNSMSHVEEEHLANYLVISESYKMLNKFAHRLPPKNNELKEYINSLIEIWTNANITVDERVFKVLSLPDDKKFIEKLKRADDCTPFLITFVQVLKRIISSIVESVLTRKSIIYVYCDKTIKDLMKNIETSIKEQGTEPTYSVEEPNLPFTP